MGTLILAFNESLDGMLDCIERPDTGIKLKLLAFKGSVYTGF